MTLMTQSVRKAVFPVAGLGTRFLPATKASPKEMLPIVDKPLIQYAVEEALEAGITELIFVTSSSKRPIEDHFDSNYELEAKLKEKGKFELLEQVQEIVPPHVNCIYVRQREALGLGHAVLCAREVVADEPFAVLLADDLIDCGEKNSCLKQMMSSYEYVQNSVLAIEHVAYERLNQYGIVAPKTDFEKGHAAINGIVEKPEPEQAPSQYGVVGRYILTSEIFQLLQDLPPGSGNEVQLTDAIDQLVHQQSVYAMPFHGKRFDCGSKPGFLEATLNYAAKRSQMRDVLKQFYQNNTNLQ